MVHPLSAVVHVRVHLQVPIAFQNMVELARGLPGSLPFVSVANSNLLGISTLPENTLNLQIGAVTGLHDAQLQCRLAHAFVAATSLHVKYVASQL